jgi:Phage integrase family
VTTADLLGSFGTWRDRAIAGLMLYCGLRGGETLALNVTDVDIGGRWVLVTGKGDRRRRVLLDGAGTGGQDGVNGVHGVLDAWFAVDGEPAFQS